MPQVGTIEYITIRDDAENIAPPANASENVTRPNVDGTAIRLMGKKGQPFQKIAERDVLNSGEQAFIDSLFLQKGTIVTLIDDSGISWLNVFVMNVEIRSRADATTRAGGLTDPSLPAKLFVVSYLLVDTRAAP